MKRFILVLLVLLVVLGNSQSYSQTEFGKKRREWKGFVLRDLNLTPHQTRIIASILKDTRNKVKEIEKQIVELRKENYEIIKNYPPDKEKFLKNQEKISDLLKQIHLIRAKGYIEIISVLDSEQYKVFIDRTMPRFYSNFSEE